MFPEAKDRPAGRCQRVGLLTIAVNVPLQLRRPVLAVDCWRSSVLGTAMPKAAVDEYGNPALRERYVGANKLAIYPDREIPTKPVARSVQG